MASKKVSSKETIKSSIGEEIEKTWVAFLVYADTHLFIEKGSSLTWQQIKDAFEKEFEVDLEEQ